MNASRLLVLAMLTSGCGGSAASDRPPTDATEAALQEGERKTSTDPSVNPDAAAMAEFKKRVDAYADLNQELAKGDAKLKETEDPARIAIAKQELAAKLQSARVDAKHGDVFTPEI